jgi:putative membrane protein
MTMLDKIKAARPPALPKDLGEMRTVMAADRTLMAWVRTAMAMLSFSFTIYKFLEDFQGKRPLGRPDLPQHIGLFLAGMGTFSIVMGTVEYWSTLKDLNRADRFALGRPVLLVAFVLSLAGVALFISIAFRLF